MVVSNVMKWDRFVHPDPNIGRVASVYLSEDRRFIKKYYNPDNITVSGEQTIQTPEYINQKWEAEVASQIQLHGLPWVPKLVEINVNEKSVTQEYYGPDLLIQGYDDIPDIEDQIVEIYKYFKEIDVYKLNGALSNMTKLDGKVIMFDFKYMRRRTDDLKPYALYEINEWLSKISPTLAPRLKELI
jgi:hypothetical protein